MVESSSEDYSDLSIIYSSSGQLVPVVAVNPDIDQELKNDVAKTLLGMHDSREGREVLEEMHFNMFVEMDHETYAEYGNNL
jgi:phosphonate transport system substrate-binding protein